MAERAKYAVATLRRRPRGGDFSRACCAFDTRVTIVVGAHSFVSYDVFFTIGSFVVNATTSVLDSSVSVECVSFSRCSAERAVLRKTDSAHTMSPAWSSRIVLYGLMVLPNKSKIFTKTDSDQ